MRFRIKSLNNLLVVNTICMQLISTILNISFGQADIYRRAIEKKKKFPDIFKDFEENFVEKGLQNKFSAKVCKYVQQAILDNAGYSFNRSHAYAYSYLTIWMCWVKANFPLCWYAIMLDDDISKFNEYLAEARSHNITVLLPHVSSSSYNTIIANKNKLAVRTGLSAIKGVGDAAIEEIIAHQPYASINDYMERAGKAATKKNTMEALIKADAFAGLPIKFDNITDKDNQLYGKEDIVLQRSQMVKWYDLALSHKDKKAEKCYEIAKENISRSLQEDPTLVFENNDTIVVPYSFLEEFGVDPNTVTLTKEEGKLLPTRKRPKGRLAQIKPTTKLPYWQLPFLNDEEEILAAKKNDVQEYIEDIKVFGYSLRKHPLDKFKMHIAKLNEMRPGAQVCIAGLITKVNQRISKNNKPYYVIEIVTPHETYEQFFFGSRYRDNQNKLQVGNFIRFRGLKDERGGVNQINDIEQLNV